VSDAPLYDDPDAAPACFEGFDFESLFGDTSQVSSPVTGNTVPTVGGSGGIL
jgi:hypothetical protein